MSKEVDFDEIERVMKSNKKASSKSSTDIADIKAKVMEWLMKNGNIKKVAIGAAILVLTGLVNIVIGIVHNTYYLRYALLLFLFIITVNYIDNKYLKKLIKKSFLFIMTKIMYLITFIWLINFMLYINRLVYKFKENRKNKKKKK